MAVSLNQYNPYGEAFWRGCEERICHDVDAAGNCRVPWCTYTRGSDNDHVPLDLALNEPARFNLPNNRESWANQTVEMRNFLMNEFQEQVSENEDAHLLSTHQLTLMVLRLLKNKADRLNDKLKVLGEERDKWMRGNEESSTLWQYITETWPMRVTMLEREGHKDHAVSFIIALFESLRTDLMQAAESVAEKVTVKSVFPKGDHMTPQARRNVTLNDLHVMLQGLVLSGADIAVRDLHEYVERHVRAVHALVHTSLELEGYSEECCVGCTEHGSKNDDQAKRNEEYSRASVLRFMIWLRDEYTGDFSVSEKAREVLDKAP